MSQQSSPKIDAMGLFDSITGWLRKEKQDVADAIGGLTDSLDQDLTRKERELTASPEDRLEMLQDEIEEDPLAEIRDRIEHSTAHADATAEIDHPEDPENLIEESPEVDVDRSGTPPG